MSNETTKTEVPCKHCKELRRQLTIARENNHERNLELDALHYVWCDGGCEGGTHRWSDKNSLTQEVVELAVRNTERLVKRYGNLHYKKEGKSVKWRFLGLFARFLIWMYKRSTASAWAVSNRHFNKMNEYKAILAKPENEAKEENRKLRESLKECVDHINRTDPKNNWWCVEQAKRLLNK